MLDIGGIRHQSRVLVAPMAGVTDRPFRDFCRSFGAHWLVGEMLTSNQALWQSKNLDPGRFVKMRSVRNGFKSRVRILA